MYSGFFNYWSSPIESKHHSWLFFICDAWLYDQQQFLLTFSFTVGANSGIFWSNWDAANERNMRGPGVTSHKREIQQTRKKRQKILLAKPISPKCMQRKTSFLQRFCHLLAARVSTEAPYVANDGWRRTNWVGHLGWWQHHFFTFLGAEKLWICNILWNQRSVREHLFLISRTPQLKARSMCCFQFDLILLLLM